MKKLSIIPNDFTLLIVARACCELNQLGKALDLLKTNNFVESGESMQKLHNYLRNRMKRQVEQMLAYDLGGAKDLKNPKAAELREILLNSQVMRDVK